jgi:hypothetical protein
VLDIRGIGVGVPSGVSEVERCDQTLGVNRVGQSLKQLERAQSPAEQLQPLSIRRKDAQHGGPLLGDLAEQFEPGTVLEPFRGHDGLKYVRAQQIQAIAFVRHTVDAVQVPERSSDRQVTGRILVDNEHTHAGKLPAGTRFGLSGRSRFPYCLIGKTAFGRFSDISFVSAGKKRGFCRLPQRVLGGRFSGIGFVSARLRIINAHGVHGSHLARCSTCAAPVPVAPDR